MPPIKTAVLGTGVSAFVFHFPFLEALPSKFEIYACLERRATVTQSKARSAYPNILVYTNLDELLADVNIELVVVSLPPNVHSEIVKKALNAGKHVVCEKPFTPTYEEAKELYELAESKSLLLAIYQNRRWDGDFLTAKKIIESGRLGQVVEFESHFDRYRLGRKSGSWKDEPRPGNGMVYGIGSHLIDQAVSLFGTPYSVTAKLEAQRQIPPLEVEDYFRIILHYPAKGNKLPINVILSSTNVSCGCEMRFCIKGTRGSFMKFGFDPQESQLHSGMKPNDHGFGTDRFELYGNLWTVPLDADVKALPEPTKITVPTVQGNYRDFYDAVFEEILKKANEFPIKSDQVLAVEKIMEAAYKSSESSSSIQL
ncbi:gfo/idh/mocA family oxidoreductase [Schizosaccharomyces pombe]|uniref:Uncharacterized oxidoreductase C115.03 n=1 Tax=Schizosaccharomyces pombe (strain 972 / ATCC 24843) TaxID=284812 RepID=YBQ3_SCHPO|nr:putative gfo/idh/mocA family oxidoreductase [Schizosaccharomyces pombe]O42896.1 RecName: Full=Uncharacterized oxidoreductase C115.03 [Schizosaccharomyces pombe 972h-]CAB46711.2 gfo/idh/mocA family oxidoreductase (predicted) [Schizosaccharomyces pombe]|eukprot:NP_001342893.1 putative gfo/idh/mocA family oxidoreductase [Schizosaccharomyces pombe]